MNDPVTRFRPRRHLALLGGTVHFSDIVTVLRHLIAPSKLVEGDAIARYETAFAHTVGTSCGVSFSSARVGLLGLLRSFGVGPGDEVLLQVPTHVVVANAVRFAGATPVYVDCLPYNYNIDLADAQRKITPRTKVLLVQHTFGIPVPLDAALALASRHGLILLEDCVHALGSRYNGKMVGSFGHAAFFSTEETKTISTTMGGMVVTDDHALAQRLREFQRGCAPPSAWLSARYLLKLLMYYFLAEPHLHLYTRGLYELCGRRLPLPRPTVEEELYGLKPAGFEKRLSNAQAAVGLGQLEQLEENLAHRRAISALYADGLARLGFRLPSVPALAEPAYVRFPVWVSDRPALVRDTVYHLVLGTWFTSVLEEAVTPACGDYRMGSCPVAEGVARHLVNLPTHPRVTAEDAQRLMGLLGRMASGETAVTEAKTAGVSIPAPSGVAVTQGAAPRVPPTAPQDFRPPRPHPDP